jgi:hypothetical protein
LIKGEYQIARKFNYAQAIYIFIEKRNCMCSVVIALHPQIQVILLIMAVNLLVRGTHQSPINDKQPLAAGLATEDLIFRLNYGLVASKQQKVVGCTKWLKSCTKWLKARLAVRRQHRHDLMLYHSFP